MDAEKLKAPVIDRLKEAGFVIIEGGTLLPPSVDKESLRQFHLPATQLEIISRQDWLRRPFFANSNEVTPEHINPALVEVTTEQRHLPLSELVAWWQKRWLLLQAERVDRWRAWRKEEIRGLLLSEQDKATK